MSKPVDKGKRCPFHEIDGGNRFMFNSGLIEGSDLVNIENFHKIGVTNTA
ncbi:hypothetical protein GCM10028809_51240 [Spirosoma gilvum]